MKGKLSSHNITDLIIALRQQQVIAYPTEAVFGFGCDPDSENAIRALLSLKNRPWQKGLILVAAYYAQLKKYINDNALDDTTRSKVFASWPGHVTWVIPSNLTTSHWLTGQYTSLAVRISAFEPVRRLCLAFDKPLVSTSANLTGQSPMRTANEVRKQLGFDFPVLDEAIERRPYPSEIRDALSGELIRKG